MTAIPAALREALEALCRLEPYADWNPSPPLRADRARAMAAALRWAQTAGHDYTTGEASVTDVIAALEQEATP